MKTLRNLSKMSSKKNILFISFIICLFFLLYLFIFFNPFSFQTITSEKVSFRTNDKVIEYKSLNKWETFDIKGINIGTGYPGVFPNEFGINEDTYYRWFEMIGEMNVNTVRVYQLQSPYFYNALLEYNQSHDKKIFLLQGIDFSEKLMYSNINFLENENQKELFTNTRNVIDAVHGQKSIYHQDSKAMLKYKADVSSYVMGYILGIEWDEIFVSYQCELNQEISGFKGEYLYSHEDANAFEVFLAEWGNECLSYEDKKYGIQKLITFSNWPDTDPLENEIDEMFYNDEVVDGLEKNTEAFVDVDKIQMTELVHSGIFASYNVYPYFPYFLQAGDYTTYIDENGQRNPYRKYLMELVNYHTYPVIITEYGVPSSRSTAFYDSWRNFSHGGLNEKQQGEALIAMYHDIQKAGCAGSFVFSWQEEWYKKVWNEQILSDANRRAFWSNAQSVEQTYGLLTFEPGKENANNYPDGIIDEWSIKDIVYEKNNISLSMKADEKYVYFLAKGLDQRNNHDAIHIALNVTPNSGALMYENVSFSQPVDFIIQINSKGNSQILVQDYYDVLLHSLIRNNAITDVDTYNQFQHIYHFDRHPKSSSQQFRLVSRASGRIDGMKKNLLIEEVGKLKEGNANPNDEDYDSNADYKIQDDIVEIRIPWQLLNFQDPSQGKIVDDYFKHNFQIKGLEIDKIYASAYVDDEEEKIEFGEFKLHKWNQPQFHERLKESYYMLKDEFAR